VFVPEIRNPKSDSVAAAGEFWTLQFFCLWICFGFRISDFGFGPTLAQRYGKTGEGAGAGGT
jgi:hypothetical protein